MKFKSDVKLGALFSSQALLGMLITDQVFRSYARECTITSVADGKHGANSLHYQGRAFDVRTRDLGVEMIAKIYDHLRDELAMLGFDVVLEGDHLHVEWDPKPAVSVPT